MSEERGGTFDTNRFLERSSTRWLGRSVDGYRSVASTMDVAQEAIAGGAPHGHLVIADAQSAARGSRGREWLGEHQLTFSFLLRTSLPLSACPPLTLATGLGVSDAINAALTDAAIPRSTIKWPNDVLLGEEKVAGILSESHGQGGIVVGIGVNRVRDESLSAVGGTSLEDHGVSLSREELLALVVACLERTLDDHLRLGAAHTAEALERRLAWAGERVQCGDTIGTLRGVAPDGRLLIHGPEQVHAVAAGTLRRCD